MSRVFDCPNCKQRIGVADPPEIQENIALHQEIEELKTVTKMPSHIPNYQCKNGNCGQPHKNSRYDTAPKGKCRDCDQFNSTSEGICSWCKSDDIDEVSEEELKDLNIRLPN